jgi:hypothetical protein
MIRHETLLSPTTGRQLHRWRCECDRVSVALADQAASERSARLHIEWHRDAARAELAAMPEPRVALEPVEPRRIRDRSDIAGETRDRFAAVFGEDFLTEIAK